jgi:GTP-binding protein LepA
MLELTGLISSRKMVPQFLDKMDLERERGITIKAQAVMIPYRSVNGSVYSFNLIDTPGHVDFTYEVSRSLSACEGAILVVDATQGVEAQTLSNVYLALDNNLEIIPVLNKIDLPAADPKKICQEIEEVIGLDCSDAILVSAKQGIGIENLLEAIITRIPPPKGSPLNPLKALIFDSWYDAYHGAVPLIRIVEGCIKKGMKIQFYSNAKKFEVFKVGIFSPDMKTKEELQAGEVGYLMAGIKSIQDAKHGDTIMEVARPFSVPLSGFKEVKPLVFCGLYPVDSGQYANLREAIEKLRLNDPSFSYEPETSLALGFGFRCGFLGLLHMEIIQERLTREFSIDLISTLPTVLYKVIRKEKKFVFIENPSNLPPLQEIASIEEPFVLTSIHVPKDYLGNVLKLCDEKRGEQKKISFLSENRILLQYEMPLSEIIFDFYDRLKSISRGYASLEYDFLDFKASDMVKLDILLNGDSVDALSLISHKEKAYPKAKALTEKLRSIIPRQLFEVAIQASIGNKVIARETIPALRKNVTAKCYGGDITRKRKLLEKQKEGKKRMKRLGHVEVPQEAFLALLKVK